MGGGEVRVGGLVLYAVLYTVLYAVLYTVLYTILYTVLYTVLCTVLYAVAYAVLYTSVHYMRGSCLAVVLTLQFLRGCSVTIVWSTFLVLAHLRVFIAWLQRD